MAANTINPMSSFNASLCDDPLPWYSKLVARANAARYAEADDFDFPEAAEVVHAIEHHLRTHHPTHELEAIATEGVTKTESDETETTRRLRSRLRYAETLRYIMKALRFLDEAVRREAMADQEEEEYAVEFTPKVEAEWDDVLQLWPDVILCPVLVPRRTSSSTGGGTQSFTRIRPFPLYILGVSMEPVYADGRMRTPLEFFFHDLDHMRYMVRENLLLRGIRIPDPYQLQRVTTTTAIATATTTHATDVIPNSKPGDGVGATAGVGQAYRLGTLDDQGKHRRVFNHVRRLFLDGVKVHDENYLGAAIALEQYVRHAIHTQLNTGGSGCDGDAAAQSAIDADVREEREPTDTSTTAVAITANSNVAALRAATRLLVFELVHEKACPWDRACLEHQLRYQGAQHVAKATHKLRTQFFMCTPFIAAADHPSDADADAEVAAIIAHLDWARRWLLMMLQRYQIVATSATAKANVVVLTAAAAAAAEASPTAAEAIPVLNARQWTEGSGLARRMFAQQLREACHFDGVFYLTQHAIPESLTTAALNACHSFFQLPLADKLQLHISKSPHFRGFSDMRNERDFREQLHFGVEPLPSTVAATAATDDDEYHKLHGPNLWPIPLGDKFKQTILDYMEAANQVAQSVILPALAYSVSLPTDYFLDNGGCRDPYLLLKMICYFAQRGVAHPNIAANNSNSDSASASQPTQHDDASIASNVQSSVTLRNGVAAHCDYSWVTLLLQDDIGGLEVQSRRTGEWVPVLPLSGSLIVNLGELMQVTTKNYFVATPHRVVNRSCEFTRYSIPVFVNPNLHSHVSQVPSLPQPILDLLHHHYCNNNKNCDVDAASQSQSSAFFVDHHEHVHRVFDLERTMRLMDMQQQMELFVFGEAEWDRKGRNGWCYKCAATSS